MRLIEDLLITVIDMFYKQQKLKSCASNKTLFFSRQTTKSIFLWQLYWDVYDSECMKLTINCKTSYFPYLTLKRSNTCAKSMRKKKLAKVKREEIQSYVIKNLQSLVCVLFECPLPPKLHKCMCRDSFILFVFEL